MIKLMISHESRQLFRSGALWSVLGLVVAAIVFAAWAGGRSIDRQVEGAQAAEQFEDGRRTHLREGVERYEAQVIAEGGEYQFASVRHAPGMGPPQGTNAGAVGAETAMYVSLPPTALVSRCGAGAGRSPATAQPFRAHRRTEAGRRASPHRASPARRMHSIGKSRQRR